MTNSQELLLLNGLINENAINLTTYARDTASLVARPAGYTEKTIFPSMSSKS